MDYTQKEKRDINRAWAWLGNLAERNDRAHMPAEIIRYERNGRGYHTAKAVLVGCVVNGYLDIYGAEDLFGLSWGCQWCVIFGSYLKHSCDDSGYRLELGREGDAVQRFLAAAEKAKVATQAHTARLVSKSP